MADREYTSGEWEIIKKYGLEYFLKSEDADYKEISDELRKARESADASTKEKVFKGEGVFSDIGEGKIDVELDPEPLEDQGGAAAAAGAALTKKAVDQDLRIEVWRADDTYYVSASSREVCMRSMERQGIKISKTDLTSVAGARGERTRFNSFDNHHPKHYASGSHKIDGGGPRIQGPSGGPGSCKFVIIQR